MNPTTEITGVRIRRALVPVRRHDQPETASEQFWRAGAIAGGDYFFFPW